METLERREVGECSGDDFGRGGWGMLRASESVERIEDGRSKL